MRPGPWMLAVLSGPVLCITVTSRAGETPGFTASSISLAGEIQEYRIAPLNEDERLDFVVTVWSQERGRELLVYLQRPGGDFPAQPDRTVAVKNDVVALALADVRKDPGKELLLFTRSSCFSYSTAQPGYAGNARREFQAEFLWDLPDRTRAPFLPDPTAGPNEEILIPVRSGYLLYGRSGEEPEFRARARFPAAVRERRPAVRPRRSFGGVLSPSSREPFEEVVAVRPSAPSRGDTRLIGVERWLGSTVLADANGDRRADVLYTDIESSQRLLKVFLRSPVGDAFREEPSWSGGAPEGKPLQVADLDGDGLVDLAAVGTGEPGEATVKLYRNEGGRYSPESPDQVLKFSGYGLEVKIVDLDRDGSPELAASIYDFSVTGAISGGRVTRRLLIYRRDGRRLFGRRPVGHFTESFGPDTIKGIGQRIDLESDLRGRGRRDAILVGRDGVLEARDIDKEFQIAERAFWRFVPPRLILEFRAVDFNRDRRSDFVLRHSRSLTLLVSQVR